MSKTTKRTVIRWTKRIVLGAGGLGIAGAIALSLLPKPIPADVTRATRGALEVAVAEDGQTRVRDRFVVAAPITGELGRVVVEPGALVDRGSVLARIEPSRPALLDDRTRQETVARLAAARARERSAVSALERTRAASELAASEATRARTLLAKGAITGTEHDRATTSARIAADDVVAAEQARAAALAEIQALRAVLEPRTGTTAAVDVVAPARGRVLRVLRESAGPVATGTPLVEIGDVASLEVVIDVLSRDAERIAPGMPVEITTASAQPVRGTVTLVEPAAFTRVSALGVEEQRVNVIVCFDAGATLGDAYRVDARVITWRGEDVLRVPASALFRDHDRWAVFALVDGRARLRPVEIGHRGHTDVEIARGLAADEPVLLHPSDQIADGVKITPRRSR